MLTATPRTTRPPGDDVNERTPRRAWSKPFVMERRGTLVGRLFDDLEITRLSRARTIPGKTGHFGSSVSQVSQSSIH